MARRVPATRDRLASVEELGRWQVPRAVRDLPDACELPDAAPSALVQGDLHLRHLLVDDAGGAAAVIDWGDVCLGDPAVDLALYWCLLPPPARATFRQEYGETREDQLICARVLALFLCAALTQYACGEGLERLARETVAGLRRTAAE